MHLVGFSSPPPHHPPPSARRAAEHFPEAFTEVFGHQGIDDGVEAGVGISREVGQDAQDIGGDVEREVSRPHPHDDQVVGEPAEAEDGGDDDDHLGDFPLGSPQLGHVIDGVHAGPQVSNGAGVGEAKHQDGDQVAKDEGAHVHDDARFGPPGGNTHHSGDQVQLAVVAEVRSGENQSQGPNQADGDEGVSGCSHLSGAERVADRQVPVQRETAFHLSLQKLALQFCYAINFKWAL